MVAKLAPKLKDLDYPVMGKCEMCDPQIPGLFGFWIEEAQVCLCFFCVKKIRQLPENVLVPGEFPVACSFVLVDGEFLQNG